MNFNDAFKKLAASRYYVFSFEDFCAFWPAQKRDTLKQYLHRWKAHGLLCSLRRGLYELTFPSRYPVSDMYLANKIYAPSYVSLETALSHYSIIPEVSMAVTSITSKPTRRFKNAHALFIYRSVRPKAFQGYRIERHRDADVLLAEPEKAVVDYLYFKTRGRETFDPEKERLDVKRVRRLDRKKMDAYAGLYGITLKDTLYAYL